MNQYRRGIMWGLKNCIILNWLWIKKMLVLTEKLYDILLGTTAPIARSYISKILLRHSEIKCRKCNKVAWPLRKLWRRVPDLQWWRKLQSTHSCLINLTVDHSSHVLRTFRFLQFPVFWSDRGGDYLAAYWTNVLTMSEWITVIEFRTPHNKTKFF